MDRLKTFLENDKQLTARFCKNLSGGVERKNGLLENLSYFKFAI